MCVIRVTGEGAFCTAFLREKTGSLLYDASSLPTWVVSLLPLLESAMALSAAVSLIVSHRAVVLGLLKQGLTVGYCTDDQHVTIYSYN